MGGRFSFEDIPFVKVAAFLLGVLVKNFLDWFFTTKGAMSAQRAQRGCNQNEFALIQPQTFVKLCGSLGGLCGKSWQ